MNVFFEKTAKWLFAACIFMMMLALPITASAAVGGTFTVNGITYTVRSETTGNKGTAAVGNGSSAAINTNVTSVTIPETVNYGGITYDVTEIASYAFYLCYALTSVTIPDSVTTIDDEAFYYCSSLTSVTIPDSVTTIGDGAFYYCSSLTSVAIPDSVTTIGVRTFDNCSSLTSITIPDSVTMIGDYAFYDCSGLTSVTIPDSVTMIGNSAFSNCSGLTSITISDSVTTISDAAFYDCSGLTSVAIGSGVTSMGYNAFGGCIRLTEINVSDDNAMFTSVDDVIFTKDMARLYYYPGGKTGVYTIPDSVTTIGAVAFDGRSGLTSITIPDSVTTISNYAFYDCSGLTSVTIPDSVTTIGGYAFYGCSGLTSIAIGSGVTSMGDSAFGGCIRLTEINVSDDNAMFTSVDDVIFTKDMARLYYYPGGKTGVYTIPDRVTTIDRSAFSNCIGLTSITIPDSVTTIGEGAFYACSGLTSVIFDGDAPQVDRTAFRGIAGGARAFVYPTAEGFPAFGELWNGLIVTERAAGLVFTDKDGAVLEHLSADTLTATLTYQNTEETAQALTMILAVYDPDGKLLYTATETQEVDPSHWTDFDASLDLPENTDGSFAADGHCAKVFVWAADTFIPVSESYFFQ